MALLDVRDALHAVAGRADRPAGSRSTGTRSPGCSTCPTATPRSAHVRGLARRLTHLSRLAWRTRRGGPARRRARPAARRPRLRADRSRASAVSVEEVVLDRGAEACADDPVLLLRAAAAAAERDLRARPARGRPAGPRGPPLPDPWPAEARDLFVRLLAAGPGLLGVWEALDETGALDRLLPEWERVRLLPHATPCTASPSTGTSSRPASRRPTLIRAGRPARPAAGRRAAARHRQGLARRPQRGRRADRPRHRAADGLRRARRSSSSVTSCASTCCCPRPPPAATSTTRRTVERRRRRGRRPRGARTAGRAHRGRRPGDRGEAWTTGGPRWSRTLVRRAACRARRRGRARRRHRRDRDPRPGAATTTRPSRSVARPSADGSRVTVVVAATGSACSPTPPACSALQTGLRPGGAGPGPQDGFGGLGLGRRRDRSATTILLRQRLEAISTAASTPTERLRPGRPRCTLAARRSPYAPDASPRATVIEVRAARPPRAAPPGRPRPGRHGRLRALGPRVHAGRRGGRRVLRRGGRRGRPVRGAAPAAQPSQARSRLAPTGDLAARSAYGGHEAATLAPLVLTHGIRGQTTRVRHPLRPPRRHLQEPARQGPAVRGRHRRHRARDPIALLEADVALPVVKDFIAAVKERARGAEVSEALNPAQQVIKIVNEELVAILGGETRRLRFAKNPPTVIMLAGLQGAGKTTLAGKLALLAQGAGHTARCWSPPTSSAPTPSTSSRWSASAPASRSSRPSRATASATRSQVARDVDRARPAQAARRRHRRHRRPPRHRRRS